MVVSNEQAETLLLPMAQKSHSNHDSIDEQIQMAMQVKTSADFWVTIT